MQPSPASAAAAVTLTQTLEEAGTGVLAELPLGSAIGAVIGAGLGLISIVTDTLVENYKGEEQLAAIESVVIVENNRILSMAKEHTQERPSTKDQHEEGQARRARDRGGEQGDQRRNKGGRPIWPRTRPAGWKGPYPPPGASTY